MNVSKSTLIHLYSTTQPVTSRQALAADPDFSDIIPFYCIYSLLFLCLFLSSLYFSASPIPCLPRHSRESRLGWQRECCKLKSRTTNFLWCTIRLTQATLTVVVVVRHGKWTGQLISVCPAQISNSIKHKFLDLLWNGPEKKCLKFPDCSVMKNTVKNVAG